eukprot:scaffold10192_cov138-Chaetoceros_neogracile.AAC.3
MERIVDSRRITIGRAVGEDVIVATTNDSIDPRNAAVVTPPLSSQSIRNLYNNIRTSESLSTPFNSNTGSNGNVFQVNAINCVVIRALHVNNISNSGTSAAFSVYKKSGPLLPGHATDSTVWPLAENSYVTLLPRNEPSPLPEDAFTAIHMDAGTSVSLYVTRTDGGDIGYTNGIAVGNIAAKDNNIEILEGYGNDYFFDATTSPQVWNGIIEYDQCSNKKKYPNCDTDYPAFIGDGICDDIHNIAECGFDEGDCASSGSSGSFPVWPVVGGVAAFLFIAIGIVICKKKRNTSTMQDKSGAGVQTGNAKYDMNNQQETSSVQPSAVPVYAFEAAPTTKPTAFCVNCGKAKSTTAFCTGCGVPNGGADKAVVVGYDCTTRNQVW